MGRPHTMAECPPLRRRNTRGNKRIGLGDALVSDAVELARRFRREPLAAMQEVAGCSISDEHREARPDGERYLAGAEDPSQHVRTEG